MAFDKKKDNSINHIQNQNLSQPSKNCNKRRQISDQMGKEKEGVQFGNCVDDSNWSLSVDNDFIVFCFKEDGGFDVVKDYHGVKSEAHKGVTEKHKKSRPVNRKVCSHSSNPQIFIFNQLARLDTILDMDHIIKT